MKNDYIKLGDLEVYQLSLEFSNSAWIIYEKMDWQIKKVIGDQFIRSVDSVGANIAEGYGRFHYKDRVKFYYNSRGSLVESKHWILLLFQREIIKQKEYQDLFKKAETIHRKINSHIKSCCKNIKN